MTELIELIVASLPAASGFAAVSLLIAALLRLMLKKPVLSFWTVTGCIYLGFLLAGTLRPESISELFDWTTVGHMSVSFQLDFSDSVSSLHGLFNIALFLPWGVIGMIVGKKPITLLPCLLSCVLMTFFIETYQLFHMRGFDFGDIVTNIAGCVIGIILMLPFVIWQRFSSTTSPSKSTANTASNLNK